jgi:hypothetical protein
MDVKDPTATVRHPLSGLANDAEAEPTLGDRAQRQPDYRGDDRPKDIIGPKDHKEPDYKDIKDFVEPKDYKDVKDFKDFVEPKDYKDVKDVKDIKDFVGPKDHKDYR